MIVWLPKLRSEQERKKAPPLRWKQRIWRGGRLSCPHTPCGDLRSRMRSSATMQYCSNRRGVSSCPKTNLRKPCIRERAGNGTHRIRAEDSTHQRWRGTLGEREGSQG